MNDNDNIISFGKAKEKKMNTQPNEPVNKHEPADFEIVDSNGELHHVYGFIGLYPEFIIFGDDQGNVKKVFNKDSWYTIENISDEVIEVALESEPEVLAPEED